MLSEGLQSHLEEKRIPKRVKDERPQQYQIDQDYTLSYLALLDDVVYLQAKKIYWDSFDTKEVLRKLKKEGRKDKFTSYNTAYLATAFSKSLHPNCYYNFRYTDTLSEINFGALRW